MQKETRELIEKYFEGKTSIEEEKKLKNFFSHENVPADLAKYRAYFSVMKTEKERKMKDIDFEPPTSKTRLINSATFRRWSIAAVIILLVGLGLFFDNKRNQNRKQEVTEAYKKTESALQYAGFWMNKGVSEAEELAHFNRGLEKIAMLDYYEHSTNKMQKLSTFNKGYLRMNMISTFTNYQPIKN